MSEPKNTSAFGHDKATGHLNPEPEKKGRFAKMVDTGPKAISLIVALIALLVLFGLNRGKVGRTGGSHNQSQAALSAFPKTIAINDGRWEDAIPVINRDATQQIEGSLITDDVWWEVMLDDNPKLVFPLYPRNWKTNSAIRLPKSSINRWRIKPGQKIKTGTVIAEIVPNTD
jgi:hypothetical protein